MKKGTALYGAVSVVLLLSILSLWKPCSHQETQFFLHRALAIRTLPDPAQGILTTYPPLPVLFALLFREYFPLVTGWFTASILLFLGERRGNVPATFLTLFSPLFLFGVFMRPALILLFLCAALGFTTLFENAKRGSPEGLLTGNLAFGLGACCHPLGAWLLPLFALCEAFSFRTPLLRRIMLVALALLPFLILKSMVLFFGWVYEGYALSPFRNPELSLAVFLKIGGYAPQVADTLLALPFLFTVPFSGLHRTGVFWGIFLLSLSIPYLMTPCTSLLLALLFALDAELGKTALLGVLLWNVLGWVLVLCGFFPC